MQSRVAWLQVDAVVRRVPFEFMVMGADTVMVFRMFVVRVVVYVQRRNLARGRHQAKGASEQKSRQAIHDVRVYVTDVSASTHHCCAVTAGSAHS